MLVTGSHDVAAPLVLEQIRIFQRLTVAHQYLALIDLVLIGGKSHLRDVRRFVETLDLEFAWSPLSALPSESSTNIEETIQALSLAFFNQYLRPSLTDCPYLNAGYGQYLSQPLYDCWLISDRAKPTLMQKLQALDEERLAEFSPLRVRRENKVPG